MTSITTASGRTRRIAPHVDTTTVVGLSEDGRVVVFEDWMGDYAFGLTLCCDAWDKGMEHGAGCRACYGDDAGEYFPRAADGSFPGVDPLASLAVPH